MIKKFLKIGYFSLPEGTPQNFPKKFLYLDKDNKIRSRNISGQKISYYQFARSLSRGDITPTKEGDKFVKEAIKESKM